METDKRLQASVMAEDTTVVRRMGTAQLAQFSANAEKEASTFRSRMADVQGTARLNGEGWGSGSQAADKLQAFVTRATEELWRTLPYSRITRRPSIEAAARAYLPSRTVLHQLSAVEVPRLLDVLVDELTAYIDEDKAPLEVVEEHKRRLKQATQALFGYEPLIIESVLRTEITRRGSAFVHQTAKAVLRAACFIITARLVTALANGLANDLIGWVDVDDNGFARATSYRLDLQFIPKGRRSEVQSNKIVTGEVRTHRVSNLGEVLQRRHRTTHDLMNVQAAPLHAYSGAVPAAVERIWHSMPSFFRPYANVWDGHETFHEVLTHDESRFEWKHLVSEQVEYISTPQPRRQWHDAFDDDPVLELAGFGIASWTSRDLTMLDRQRAFKRRVLRGFSRGALALLGFVRNPRKVAAVNPANQRTTPTGEVST